MKSEQEQNFNILPHFFLILGLLMAMTNSFSAEIKGNKDTFAPTNIGRRFEYLNVHPNGKELIFVEYTGDRNSRDYHYDIFKYNIETKKYQNFVLPSGYRYSSP